MGENKRFKIDKEGGDNISDRKIEGDIIIREREIDEFIIEREGDIKEREEIGGGFRGRGSDTEEAFKMRERKDGIRGWINGENSIRDKRGRRRREEGG